MDLIKSRGFHSDTKESDIYKPLISGGNIERYFVSDEIKEYIKYGEWLGAPRDERFFNSPRVLIRQIVSGKPPRIYSAYTDKSLYYTQIGFGIIPNPDTVSVKSLLALINSKLINFYHLHFHQFVFQLLFFLEMLMILQPEINYLMVQGYLVLQE